MLVFVAFLATAIAASSAAACALRVFGTRREVRAWEVVRSSQR